MILLEGCSTALKARWIIALAKMTEIALNARYKVGDIQISEYTSPDAREGGKVAQVTATELLRHEPPPMPLVHSDFLDGRHQT